MVYIFVAPGRPWEWTHQIQPHSLKRDSDDGQRHKHHWRWFLWHCVLVLKAVLDKVLDLSIYSCPEGVILDFLYGVSPFKVAAQRMGTS